MELQNYSRPDSFAERLSAMEIPPHILKPFSVGTSRLTCTTNSMRSNKPWKIITYKWQILPELGISTFDMWNIYVCIAFISVKVCLVLQRKKSVLEQFQRTFIEIC